MTAICRPAILFFLLSIWILPGCRSQHPPSISGYVSNTADQQYKIFLIMPRAFREIAADYQGQVLDSATIDAEGYFRFTSTHLPAHRSILLLVIQQRASKFANHLVDENPAEANYMPVIYIPGESIEMEADANAFHRTFRFTRGSGVNQSMIMLRNLRVEAFEKYARSSAELQEDSLLIEKEKAYRDYIGTLMDFADTTAVEEAAFVAIRWISPTNDYERIPEFITSQCAKWKISAMNPVFSQELCGIADRSLMPVMIGDTIPDFLLPMSTGDTIRLHSLLGRKITIIDLWASWCAPCRKENREVFFPLVEKYQGKGLQMISYSLDAEADAWHSAIRRDNALWQHASHLTGDSGPFLEALRITTIPANYILDHSGIVVAKNLHGEELEQWVTKRLQE
jgi:thiol-disulfide isomerase/thioredoxin